MRRHKGWCQSTDLTSLHVYAVEVDTLPVPGLSLAQPDLKGYCKPVKWISIKRTRSFRDDRKNISLQR